jgi:hypothetical protein
MSLKEGEKMECQIDPSKIDREGILSLIKLGNNGCVACNLKVRMIKQKLYPNKTFRCLDCPFVSCSGDRKTKKNYFTTGIACGAKFKQFGIDPNKRLGKAYLFYLLYYPEFNWCIPDGSILHHKNGENWNDHKWNLQLCKDINEHNQLETEAEKQQNILNEQSYIHLR